MPTCALCGSRHDTEAGVVQHIRMSDRDGDGEHAEWESKPEIWKHTGELVNYDNEDSETTDGNEQRVKQDVGNGGSSGRDSGKSDSDVGSYGGSNPAFQGPEGKPMTDDTNTESFLLECGHERYAGEVPEEGVALTCDVCGETRVYHA